MLTGWVTGFVIFVYIVNYLYVLLLIIFVVVGIVSLFVCGHVGFVLSSLCVGHWF